MRFDWRKIIAAIVTVIIAGGAITVAVTLDEGDGGKPRGTVTVTLGGPGHAKVPLTPAAQAIERTEARQDAADLETAGKVEADLHEPPAMLPTPAELEQSEKIKPPAQPDIPLRLPAAAPNVPGCSTTLVRNYSTRRGAPVLLGVLHWTASRSIAGSSADGLAIVRWFDQPAASASSSEITDDDGRCWLVVPEALKPWTQAAYNSWSVSVEHVNPGSGPLFTHPAGRRAVVALFRGWHHRWHLPYRLAVVTQNGCRVVRSGYIDHAHLGACGGGHPDVGGYPVLALVREAMLADGGGSSSSARARLLPGERRNVACLERERRTQHRHGGWAKVASSHLRRAVACKAGLRAQAKRIRAAGHLEQRHRRERLGVLERVIAAH